jgi:dTDP-4-amino-4,6-dideoxygalactose transaminase
MSDASAERPDSAAAQAPASAPPLTVPFSRPDIGQEEIDAVVECMRSGWLTTGPRCQRFERAFAEFVGGEIEAIAVASGTAGLEIALSALGIGPGDEVITTDFTFSATAMSIVRAGATPVLIDVDEETLNINHERIADAISPRTTAVVPVHYAGLGCDLDAIGGIARRHGLALLDDAAHALPTTSNGRMVGSGTADATVFSFHPIKTITTGEGGMITAADPGVAKRARMLRFHGIDRDVSARYHAPASWRYDIATAGSKSNLTDMAAAIGIVQLRRAWSLHARRHELWERYNESLAALPLRLPTQPREGEVHAYHLYAVRLLEDAPLDRDTFILEMARAGVQCNVHFIPLHLHSYWRDTLKLSPEMFPSAQRVFEGLVTLPLFPSMGDAAQQYVIERMTDLLS